MSEFQNELEKWFINMGYPIDQAKETDWKTVCCGRMPEYWKRVMATNKPKQQVDNILKNLALQNIKRYMKYENCSALEIGTITPPPQIHYPMEQLKLQKKLDSINIQIATEKLAFNNLMTEKKHKCVDLHKTKENIIEADRKIYLMKEAIKKVKKDVSKYEKANNFSVSIDPQLINEPSIKHDTDCIKLDRAHSSSDNSSGDPLFQEILSKSELETTELCDLIIKYHRNIPQILNERLSGQKTKNCKSGDSDNNLPLKIGLTQLQIFHCRLVIAIKQLQQECKNAEYACETIKDNIQEKLSNGRITRDMFLEEYSKMYSMLHEEALRNEINALRNDSLEEIYKMSGLKLPNKNKNIYNDITNAKEKYLEIYSKIKKKLVDTSTVLEKINQTNSNIKSTLCDIKNSKMDKVLWHPDFKILQDEYLKIILKKPISLHFESNNPFGFFSYLLTIIADYNINQKLESNHETLKKEMEWLRKTCAIPRNKSINGDGIDDSEGLMDLLNQNPIQELQPYQNVILWFIRILKYKTSLENIQKMYIKENEIRPEDLLGVYMDVDLRELEKNSFSNAMKHLKKNPNFSKVDVMLIDFNETLSFFNDINKSLSNP